MEPTPLGCYFMSKFNKELKEFILRTRKYTNNNTRNKGDNIYKTLYVDLARYFLLQKEIPIGDKVVDVVLEVGADGLDFFLHCRFFLARRSRQYADDNFADKPLHRLRFIVRSGRSDGCGQSQYRYECEQ